MLPRIRLPDFDEIILSGDFLELLYEIYSNVCPERESIDIPSPAEIFVKDEALLREILFKQFNQMSGPIQPLAVDYCSRLLEKGKDYSGILFNTRFGRVPGILNTS